MPEIRYLSMPDPCPHLTRMDIIVAKVNGLPIPQCDVCRKDDDEH